MNNEYDESIFDQENVKLKDVFPDIERYFQEDCYCPNEVYSVDGFGYLLVYADAPCKVIGKFPWSIHGGSENETVTLVVTTANSCTKAMPILMNVWEEDGKVTSAERYDLSEDNLNNITAYLKSECNHFSLTEEEALAKETAQLLGLCNGVIVS